MIYNLYLYMYMFMYLYLYVYIHVFSGESFIVKEKPSRALAGGGSYWRPFVCERGNRKGRKQFSV